MAQQRKHSRNRKEVKEAGDGHFASAAAGYEPEGAADFFEGLLSALRLRPHYRRAYDMMGQSFKRCLNQLTSNTQINFGGDFAKTDYLLKEHGADTTLVGQTNDTRVRLRRRFELSDAELEQYFLFDVRNLAHFYALVFGVEIPDEIVAFFPEEEASAPSKVLMGDYLRVIVERWDDEFVYVRREDEAEETLTKVCYAKENVTYSYDWSYLKNLFYAGAQLNLVRPREADGTFYPELIIFEPDYLVNISTVARCFTSYAESPLVELIKKLEPQETTEAIVLGNLAGLLLDESIHQLPASHTYADSVKTFFRDNAIGLLSTEISREFHENAKQQKCNIDKAMHQTMPEAVGQFDSRDGIVEPSFFSEMLGLQGRMDYLQMDFSILMEQKSGKAGFAPNGSSSRPTLKQEHYVQLLLYMALIRYNFSAEYEANGRQLHAFLLYSKYDEALLRLGFAPDLLFRAFKVRNELAGMELRLATPDGYKILDTLTPDQLNEKGTTSKLWTNFQRPQIEEVLAPIHEATPLERAYFYRFLTFIANEHVLAKLGNKTKEGSGFAATWHDALSDKLAAGNIYCGLSLVYPNDTTKERIEFVELKFAETEANDLSNFRTGDIVILYPYSCNHEPDARRTMVFRGSIEEIGIDTIRLRLRNVQSDNRVFVHEQGKLWAIEHDFMEASFSSLYKGIHAFLSAPKERRDLLLLQREPKINKDVSLSGDYGDFNDLMLRVKQAQDMFLIIGPPGTGKTSFGLLNTVREELLTEGSTILLLSYTNRAVDEICSKLVAEGIDFLRIGNALTCAEEYRDRLLSTRALQSANLGQLRNMLISTRVVVGTTTALNGNTQLFRLKQFSLAVIDEASQILEPHLIGLLAAHVDGQPAIRKFVLIGDHKQLPAVVKQSESVSRVQDKVLNDILLTDCRLSLFERLLKKYGTNKAVTHMLTRQGRMHHNIALFPSDAFYAHRLEEVPLPHQRIDLPLETKESDGIIKLLHTRRVAFLSAEAPQDSPSDKVNQTEAEMIAALMVKIYEMEQKSFDVGRSVGVIVPYRNQIVAIRKAIDRHGIAPLHDITIDTVERYQGSQRKYIIYGFTVQKHYQLNFLTNNVFVDTIDGSLVDRKLNVAMTRAEEHLIMLGNARLLASILTFRRLMDFVRKEQSFFDIPQEDFLKGNFEVPPYAVHETTPNENVYNNV